MPARHSEKTPLNDLKNQIHFNSWTCGTRMPQNAPSVKPRRQLPRTRLQEVAGITFGTLASARLAEDLRRKPASCWQARIPMIVSSCQPQPQNAGTCWTRAYLHQIVHSSPGSSQLHARSSVGRGASIPGNHIHNLRHRHPLASPSRSLAAEPLREALLYHSHHLPGIRLLPHATS